MPSWSRSLFGQVCIALALGIVVGFFALFHGHAHHAEMGEGTLAAYAVGFALATAALHGAGYLIGRWLPQTLWAQRLQRAAGALIAGAGAVFLGA